MKSMSAKNLIEPGWTTGCPGQREVGEPVDQAFAIISERNHLNGMKTNALLEGVTPVYAQWNAARPFPEGNGRPLNTMLTQLGVEA